MTDVAAVKQKLKPESKCPAGAGARRSAVPAGPDGPGSAGVSAGPE